MEVQIDLIAANSHTLCMNHTLVDRKTSITCIQDNFSCLTHNSGVLVHEPLNKCDKLNSISTQNIPVNDTKCRV